MFDLSAIGEVSMKIKQVRLKQEECEYDCKIIEGSNPPKSLYKKSQIFTQSPAPTVTRHPNAKIIDSIIPINERVNVRKLLRKKSAIKNKDIINNKISNI